MDESFSGKVAIITGGASGIGKAIAQELAEHGCYLVLADVNRETMDETVAELKGSGANVDGQIVDVRDAAQVKALVEGTYKELGRIDYMFNNAGINVCAELRDTTLDHWNALIDVNLKGVVYGVDAVYPIMREQGFGHIVNTASMAGLVPSPSEGAYSATKHAVVGLSGALRIEAETFGIKVSVICPGVIETPMMVTSDFVNVEGEEILKELIEKPMPVRKAAKVMVRGVRRNSAFIVVTESAHVIWRMYRMAPSSALALGKFIIDKFRKVRKEPA